MDENEDKPKTTPAVPISAEFLSGGTAAGLEKIRARLLDLTNRNRLLNFRHTRGSIRVVDADPNAVFARLMNGEEIPFRHVPDPLSIDEQPAENGEAPPLQQPLAADHAASLGWNTDYDLTAPSRFNAGSPCLPVLHYLEDLETLSRKLGAAAKTAIEESGTNMLYVAFGFLEWYESDDSRQAHLAPLLTVPVALNRGGTKSKGFECRLEHSGEDIETNWSLVEKLRRDFAIEVPAIAEDDDPEQYFGRFRPILAQKTRWRIRRQVSLSLLGFGKLLMYRDLDAKVWPDIQKHPLVTELFDGRKNDTIVHAEEHPIDAPELRHELPALVVDADSSQHSALIDAMRGQNLVIEGPPGTGKSQTITNLIAAALTKGKTVLFVSEKLAALEVVRRRLDQAGLGLFCLELHSHKTRKDSLLRDLEARLKSRGSFRDPKDLEQHLSIVEEKKRALTRYADLINKELLPIQSTVFEILWAREVAFQQLPFDQALVENVLLPSVVQFTRTDYARTEQFISVHCQHMVSVLRSSATFDDHPWSWVGGPLTFHGQEALCDLLEKTVLQICEARPISQALTEIAGLDIAGSIRSLLTSRDLLKALPEPGGQLCVHLLPACRDPHLRSTIVEFIKAIEAAAATHQTLVDATSAGDAAALLRNDVGELLRRTAESLRASALDRLNSAQLSHHLEQGRVLEKILTDADDAFSTLTIYLGCELPFETKSVDLVLKCVLAIEDAPLNLLHWRTPQLESESAARIIRAAAVRAQALAKEAQHLDQVFDVARVETPGGAIQFRNYATTLDDAGVWQRLFGGEYRAARRTYRRLARARKLPSRHECARDFRALADHLHARDRFNANAECRALLGTSFAGVETQWEEIHTVVSWYERVFTGIPDNDRSSIACRDVVLKSRSERVRALHGSLAGYHKQRSALEAVATAVPTLTERVPSSGVGVRAIMELRDHIRTANARLEDALAALVMADLKRDIPVEAIGGLLDIADRHRKTIAFIQAQEDIRDLLSLPSHGVEDLGRVKATVRLAESIASGAIPRATSDWLLCDEYQSRLGQLREWLSQAVEIGQSLSQARERIRGLAASVRWHVDETESLDLVHGRVDQALTHREELADWLHLQRSRAESIELGLGKLTALADARQIEPRDLLPAFRFVFYNTLSRSAFTEHPDLFQFSGLTQDQIRQQFAKADKQAIRLSRERAAAILDGRRIPNGHQSGPVGTWTDLGLITKEISKQKRHIPIRQLVRRSAAALQAMKPCFMMGPLSVAQYLAPEKLRFDLIVMDEASQLKPEDAIGAIARGGQMVIVGDPKQLPPTNFFQRVALDDDDLSDDDRTALEEGESILDVASTLYQPVRRLRWHYRSRHHSLIAFSNREFYQGDLVIFPSAYHESPDLGVKYHAVRDGVFDERRNMPEAAAVVDAVLDHMQNRPGESLGVVALNFEQRELIEELLDRRLRTEPFAVAYQERMEGGPEPLFIKNLENVQGDERDVIFISGTYGPDPRGNQYQRFGPINGPNGHRRLNVLFTRAKKRTEVFSSLDPDRIQTSASSAWGLRVLKQYLTFARSGVLEASDDGGSQPTNDFERSVGMVLKGKGFDVVPQVGVAGFFIDLAIRHPTKPGAYLLGIECDGASYHSGRSARDRDRLRQEILENQGWKMHRIWSTDWFKSRNAEIGRLLKRVESLLENDPEHRQAVERAQKVTSLRQRLIDLRDSDIKRSFPDSPTEACLLRDSVLDELVRRRPRTKDDWFRVISYQQRTQTDARQVGQYLAKVLEVINDSYE